MNSNHQKWLVWIGVFLSSIFFGAYVFLMGFFPPPPPSLGYAEVANMYAVNNTEFRIGVVLMMLTCGFYLPWTFVISAQMVRHEKGLPMWAFMQGMTGTLAVTLFFLPALYWGVAAFSPEREPAITQVMHELAFLTLTTPVGIFPFQAIAIAAVCFTRKEDGEPTAFPRWMGYLTLWTAVTFEGGALAMMFKTGPFAWNGLFPFYLPFGIFGIWIGALLFMLLRAIGKQEQVFNAHRYR